MCKRRVLMMGTRHYKIHTWILDDPWPRVTRIRGSCDPQVFPRVYLWVPTKDPDSCSALDPISQESEWNMLLNYCPTFEPQGCLKKSRVNRSVRSEWVERTTELPADLWAMGLGKRIQSDPMGQEGVEYATKLPTNCWAPGIGIKKSVTQSVRRE